MDLDELNWDETGLLPVVILDARTGGVLTLAYANREALRRTLAEGSTYLFSRSRGELWRKGATSGNTQHVVSVAYDCDGDALLYRVIPNGPACHTGATSCFQRLLPLERSETPSSLPGGSFWSAIERLQIVLEERKRVSPENSYTAKLLAGGVDRIGKKIGEEATEVVIAAKNASKEEIVRESADLIYHWLVLLRLMNIPLDDVGAELLTRAGG